MNEEKYKIFKVTVRSEADRPEEARFLYSLWIDGRSHPLVGIFSQPYSESTFTFCLPDDQGKVVVGDQHTTVVIAYRKVISWNITDRRPWYRAGNGTFAQ